MSEIILTIIMEWLLTMVSISSQLPFFAYSSFEQFSSM